MFELMYLRQKAMRCFMFLLDMNGTFVALWLLMPSLFNILGTKVLKPIL